MMSCFRQGRDLGEPEAVLVSALPVGYLATAPESV